MVRMGLIVVLPLLVRVRGEASTSSGNSVGVAKAESPSPTSLKPLPNPPQREGVPSNRLKHSKNGLPPLGEGWGGALGGLGMVFRSAGEGPLPISCFSTGASRTFFTANGGFFYRGQCWRHAWHDGGDGADAQEENLFSDRHWRHHHQGEAASSAHGFLCLFQPHPNLPQGEGVKAKPHKTQQEWTPAPWGGLGRGFYPPPQPPPPTFPAFFLLPPKSPPFSPPDLVFSLSL